jgi:prolyl 4-hydroxylase
MNLLILSLIFILIVLVLVVIIIYYNYKYDVKEFENLLTSEECDILIAFATEKGLQKSDVLSNKLYGEGTKLDENNRTSKTAWLKDTDHPIIEKIALITEKLTGLPKNTQEMLQVAHYTVGGKFNSHYDACNNDSKEYCDKMNRYAGQRRATLLIYLNDDFDGGETVFTKLNKTIKPKKGKGILFWNTTSLDKIIPESIHQGSPVLNGEKWICTKWSHSREYPHS